MLGLGRRIETIKRITKSKTTPENIVKFGEENLTGSYKETAHLTNDWVIKVFKPEEFTNLETEDIKVGSLEWAKKLKIILENHIAFTRKYLGDIYDDSKIFISEAQDDTGKKIYTVYKLQKNRKKDILKYTLETDHNVLNSKFKFWDDYLSQPGNELLLEDFIKLFKSWKKLVQLGLSLDIFPNNNMTIVRDRETGKLRLKIFDAIPLFVINQNRFTRNLDAGNVPMNLVTLGPDNLGKTYDLSEEFLHELKYYFSNTSQ
jgi:hypothetical protein